MKHINILYLHGYRMNKEVMQFQARKIIKNLPESCNYYHHIINGTYISSEKPPPIIYNNFNSPFYEFCQFKYLPNDNIEYNGIDNTIVKLKNIIIKHKIDGIIAFSQGTYIASILNSYFPLKFFVSICGMKCMDSKYKINIDIPTFHIVGKKDEWYDRGIEFYKLYKNAELREHNSGHNFPKEETIYNDLIDWIKSIK